ncbi:hypothetical protein J0X14_10720 [Muricauda sp. CAU 1633]|uniref:hypothetical protein n=1 Tax=Allomuricauda sp. CAU 1633 TaxID=2816036 RepID=UPI001A8F6300|nr:hypothetical protein [Muricauda sp. CAU 1633]MBO0322771.1 hypothetical protein [Muricauda sp. CAU 1633]
MRKETFILIISLFLSFVVYSQTFNGQIIELTKNKDELKVPELDYATIYIETEYQKIEQKESGTIIPYETRIEKNGNFEIDLFGLKGETLTIYFSSKDYSYTVLKNIPKSKLSDFIKIIPIVENIWKPTCGHDCFTVDMKKTYKRKRISVDNGNEKIVFQRKIIEPKIDKEKGYLIPIPFMDIWPPDKIYFYEYEFK